VGNLSCGTAPDVLCGSPTTLMPAFVSSHCHLVPAWFFPACPRTVRTHAVTGLAAQPAPDPPMGREGLRQGESNITCGAVEEPGDSTVWFPGPVSGRRGLPGGRYSRATRVNRPWSKPGLWGWVTEICLQTGMFSGPSWTSWSVSQLQGEVVKAGAWMDPEKDRTGRR
jgi:hypothetical protein